jgi:2-polyprenyl-3-methyl-5-hydroxy-6-metoxy-1,4-benzoquinol methylase
VNDPAQWEAIHQSRHWGTYPDIHVVRQVKKFMGGWKERMSTVPKWVTPQALDIGCGAGANTGMMCDEGMNVYAFDSSETALGHMCYRLENKSFFPAKCTVQEFEAPHQFDFILDNFTLTNIEHPPWEKILSWLRPGGWLVQTSFWVAPRNTPKTWFHGSFGSVVESHQCVVGDDKFSFSVFRYVKPNSPG